MVPARTDACSVTAGVARDSFAMIGRAIGQHVASAAQDPREAPASAAEVDVASVLIETAGRAWTDPAPARRRLLPRPYVQWLEPADRPVRWRAAAAPRRRRPDRPSPPRSARECDGNLRQLPMRGEESELVREIRDAVVLEHHARTQLMLRLAAAPVRSRRRVRTRSSSPTSASSSVAERGALGGGQRDRVEERVVGRHQTTRHRRRQAAVRRAPDTAARCAAVAASGSWPRD